MVIRNVVFILLALTGFAVVHSLMAGAGLKARLKPHLGERFVEGWYRLFYNLFAAFTILPTLALLVALPDRVLYRVGMPWALLMLGMQLVGVLGLVGALFVTDVWRFAGVRQAIAYLSGDPLPLPPEPLQRRGMYAVVRHPLYLFSLCAIWPLPVMTLNVLLFNVGATLYFVVGSFIEERRMIRTYGDDYRRYRQRVSWLIPLPHRSRR
jgi:protein-S-isoprenylcysteine O-methyltransferase Ste14